MKEPERFGGEWSDTKLAALKGYLAAYMRILSKHSFRTAYIDAFAGGGTQEEKDGMVRYRHGSPLIALETEPPFDSFIFIDKDPAKLDRLKGEVVAAGHQDRKIEYRAGDANDELQALCEKRWNSHRAVAFLDPFALHVRWDTLKAIAKTEAIDLWLLFPAMAVNRMLARSGDIDEAWQQKLDETFGVDSWNEVFYGKEDPDLFGHEKVFKKPEPFDVLSKFVTLRLKEEFAGANDQPLILRNTTGSPLFLLCFACGNPKAVKPALNIANWIIKNQK